MVGAFGLRMILCQVLPVYNHPKTSQRQMKQAIDLDLFISQLRKRQEELLADYDEINAALADIERQIRTAEAVRANYQRHFRLPVTETTTLDPILRDKFASLSIKDMLTSIGIDSGGILELADARRILIRAGIFKDDRNAATSMASIISRHEDIFRRVARGRYVVLTRPNENAGPPVQLMKAPKTVTVFMAPVPIPLPKPDSHSVFMRTDMEPAPCRTFSSFGHGGKMQENQ
jgi:hypothetical protein